MCRLSQVTSSRALYKHLQRQVQLLPPPAQSHYRHAIRQGFVQHEDETDPERIQQIIERSLQDAQWVLNKYAKKPS